MKASKSKEQRLFEKLARFECQGIGCHGKPTRLIRRWFYPEDAMHYVLCDEHALENVEEFFEFYECAEIEISDIDDWNISVEFAGQKVIRVGNRYSEGSSAHWADVMTRIHRRTEADEKNESDPQNVLTEAMKHSKSFQ